MEKSLVSLLLAVMLIAPPVAWGQEVAVKIAGVEIVPNDVISGTVVGLDPAQYEQHRILVYAKTDIWYIHPYDRGGDGYHYATIRRDGTWSIRTVLRRFPADEVRIFLVRQEKFLGKDGQFRPPLTFNSLDDIQGKFIAQYAEKGRGRL